MLLPSTFFSTNSVWKRRAIAKRTTPPSSLMYATSTIIHRHSIVKHIAHKLRKKTIVIFPNVYYRYKELLRLMAWKMQNFEMMVWSSYLTLKYLWKYNEHYINTMSTISFIFHISLYKLKGRESQPDFLQSCERPLYMFN